MTTTAGALASGKSATDNEHQGTNPSPETASVAPAGTAALAALCAIARLHHVAADPATLAHQLGLSSSEPLTVDDLLHAAKHLGLKAKRSITTVERLALTPLPALALMRTEDEGLRVVILAQCDGQRVLVQDPATGGGNSRPTIEPLEVFNRQWTGELILITSHASLAGELAKFDFSWFIPSPVKHRKLLPEVLFISFMLQLFALVSPLFFQVVMDKVLVHKGLTTLDVLVYGTVQANVEFVSADAVMDEKKGSFYPAILTLAQKDMDIDGKRVPLSPGMNLTAEIKTGKRRVIEYLLSPVQRAGSESLRER